ncbi:hypothetical protein LCGC14_2800000, partial [marine sediment metagenome]
MALIRLQAFSGSVPRVENRLIDPNQATTAQNSKLLTGELKAWRSQKDILSIIPDGDFLETGTAQRGTTKTLTLADNATATSLLNHSILITAGTGVNQRRFVSAHDVLITQAWQVDDTPTDNAFVDVTTDLIDAGADDVLPFPATEAIGDYFVVMFKHRFPNMRINVGTVGVGGVMILEYWNGTAWTALSGVTDNTTSFTVLGLNSISWTVPGDWATRSINGSALLYPVRARITTVYSTNPILTQGFVPAVITIGVQAWVTIPDGTSVYSLFKVPVPAFLQTIYLFGKNTATEHWLTWNKDVDVARSPVSGDILERTYFTGLDQPRVTDNTIVDQGTEAPFPQKSFFLGVPAPTIAPALTIDVGGSGTVLKDLTYIYT